MNVVKSITVNTRYLKQYLKEHSSIQKYHLDTCAIFVMCKQYVGFVTVNYTHTFSVKYCFGILLKDFTAVYPNMELLSLSAIVCKIVFMNCGWPEFPMERIYNSLQSSSLHFLNNSSNVCL